MIDRLPSSLLNYLMSSLATVLYTVLTMAILVSAGCYVAYRRLRRDGRWARVMGTAAQPTSGPRRDLGQLRLKVEEAMATARQTVDIVDTVTSPGVRLEPIVEDVEHLGTQLCGVMGIVASGQSEEAVAAVVTAFAEPVDEFVELAHRVPAAFAANLSGIATFDLDQLRAQSGEALRIVEHRREPLKELAALGTATPA